MEMELPVTEEDRRTGGGGLAAPGARRIFALPAQLVISSATKGKTLVI